MERDCRAVRIKICGITSHEDAHAAVRAGADALGFVFHAPSPRYVTPEQAGSIIGTLPPFVTAVGVFVNRARDEIEEIAALTGLHCIQLHGNEPPEQCRGHSRPVMKAFRPENGGSFPDLSPYGCCGFLVDSVVPGAWGGTGVAVDWAALRGYLDRAPAWVRDRTVLAGGLNPRNVAEAVRIVRPFGVDVSSGVEDAPGKKNEKLIKEFINAVRNSAGTGSSA